MRSRPTSPRWPRRSRPFRVHLRGTGTFQPISPVVFVGVVQGISQCEVLAAEVLRGPLAIDRAFPFHPHVTIAHHLPEVRWSRRSWSSSGSTLPST